MTSASDVVRRVPPVLANASRPHTLYHYTSQQGLLGILEQRKLWATDIHYLNDSQEFEGAIALAKRHMKKEHERAEPARRNFAEEVLGHLDALDAPILDPVRFGVYVASFSGQGDNLSQWRGYCPLGSGFSLGFNTDDLRILGNQDFKLVRCLYDEEEQNELIASLASTALTEATEFSAAQLFIGLIGQWAAAIKDKGFREEQEWRLISAQSGPQTLFRPGKSLLVPYIEMNLANTHTPGSNMDCINSVTVGPTPHLQLAEQAIRDLLRRQRVSCTTVLPSLIPFRSW